MQAAQEAPNLASAINIGAFNLGNAIGAGLGGGVIALGLGLPAVALAGAAMAGLGLLALLLIRAGNPDAQPAVTGNPSQTGVCSS